MAVDKPPNPAPMTMTFLLLMLASFVFRNSFQAFFCQLIRRMHRQDFAEIIRSFLPLPEQFVGAPDERQATVVTPAWIERGGGCFRFRLEKLLGLQQGL